ncbi:MAG: excinuclease ABC subunit UvrC [Alphaproteobacteria bacterium]|nr:excinuclease ABC subunit UvrC [Alphaproteobacteria bacterium]
MPEGQKTIARFTRTLPASPGVYIMRDAKKEALYVGKARDLKKRVSTYTKPEKHSLRIQRMIAATAEMEFTATHTEAEALLLEANLIKKLKPRYNILLRDDKSFPFIHITGHDFPQVKKHRGAKDKGGEYFGPFASGGAVNATLAVLQKAFMLRNCSDHIFALRTRPCLQYQIKRCTAPCVNKATQKEYAEQVEMARRFLNGESRAIQDAFTKKMQDASDAQDYETAALWRDRIRALTYIQSRQTISIEGIDSADIHALAMKNGQACVQVFFFRAGQNYGSRAYFPRHDKDDKPADILAAFIAQFYTNHPIPREILTSHVLTDANTMSDALRVAAGYKVTLAHPQRGDKKELIRMAIDNAEKALAHKLAANAEHSDMLERLAETLGLDAPPERVEVYDNSHISGSHALGAMIVAGPEGFQKNAYRKFNMPTDIAGNDTAMMRRMLERRFKNAGDTAVIPDLLLIDGGQGQLNAAKAALADLGMDDLAVAAIAKGPDRNAGRETFFVPGREPFTLPPRDPLLYYLQRLRDEAHRFAITSNRGKRSRALTENPLDTIPGIGPKRKKALLLHFGSAKAVAEAGVADLQKVSGISKAAAERIYGFFHDT